MFTRKETRLLTAVARESSRHVLSSPFCKSSLWSTTVWMAAGLSAFISISWLADSKACSSVYYYNKKMITLNVLHHRINSFLLQHMLCIIKIISLYFSQNLSLERKSHVCPPYRWGSWHQARFNHNIHKSNHYAVHLKPTLCCLCQLDLNKTGRKKKERERFNHLFTAS